MTQSEREALREDVARLVMGWTTRRIPWAYSGSVIVWHGSGDIPVMTWHSWRPDENDGQCMKVLDRMVELGFDYRVSAAAGEARVAFGNDGALTHEAKSADRRIALLEAAVAALSTRARGGPSNGRGGDERGC